MIETTRELSLPIKNKNMTRIDFDSARERMEYAHQKFPQWVADDRWAGGSLAHADAIATGLKLPESLDAIAAVMDKIDASFRDREAVSWEPSVAGAYPVVPEALHGYPECMRQRMPVESDAAPIRIFVSSWTQSSITPEQMIARGAAVAALAMRLSEARPTELYFVSETAHSDFDRKVVVFTIRVPTAPLSAQDVAVLFASPCVYRQHDLRAAQGWYGSPDYLPLPFGLMVNAEMPKKMRAIMTEALELEPQDIYIPPYTAHGAEEFTDPVAWVHAMLESQREVTE